MNNTVLSSSKKRQYLMSAIFLSVIILAAMIFALVSISQIGKTNLDGTYNTTVGTLLKLNPDELSDTKIAVNNNETTYNFTPLISFLTSTEAFSNDSSAIEYLQTFVGKQIKIDTPAHLFDENNVWVVGLTVDDKVIVDASDYIAQSQKENKLLTDIFTVIVVLVGVACCGLLIRYVNTPKLQEFPLAEKYAEWVADKQPLAPTSKKQNLFLGIFTIVCLAAEVTFVALTFTTPDERLSDIMGILSLAVYPVFLLGIVLQIPISRKINIKFYDEQYPFDFTDISHMKLPKSIKTQLQENAIAFRKANPHLFADGGNPFEVNFTANGVELYEIDYDNEDEEDEAQNGNSIFAAEIEDELQIKSELDGRTPDIKFSYEQCNFEAIPVFNKQYRPLMIVIKSRLQKSFDFPENLQNDIHIVLEKTLMETFNKYKVHVEGLNELLADKLRLMTDKKLQKNYNEKNGIK